MKYIKDLRYIFVRIWRAAQWLEDHDIHAPGPVGDQRRQLWLEYLHSTVLEQFDRNVWLEPRKYAERVVPNITQAVLKRYGPNQPPVFAYRPMHRLFRDQKKGLQETHPHFVIGNRLSMDLHELLDLLMGLNEDGIQRGIWAAEPFRVGINCAYLIIQREFGINAAKNWHRDLVRLLVTTHWVLPWASGTQHIFTTKESAPDGLYRMCM